MGMALHLVVVFGSTALATSLVVGVAARCWRERASRWTPLAQSRVSIAALSAPLFLALLLVGAVALPHAWFGLPDHCLDHPGHLHLCIVHGAPFPSVAIAIAGGGLIFFLGGRLALSVSAALRGAVTGHRIVSLARREGDVWVLPGETPEAFTVGLLRPAVVVSAPVRAADERWRAVFAHERAHAAGRHPLLRVIARVLGAFHWPAVSRRLTASLHDAQELWADAEAARALGSPVDVAETLVDWMRWRRASPSGAVTFEADPLGTRVRRLLDDTPPAAGLSLGAIALTACAAFVLVASAAPGLHHTVETALGLLQN